MKRRDLSIILFCILISISFLKISLATPTVRIEISDLTEVYEGDRIPCTITGATSYSWRLNDTHTVGKFHTTFVGDDPILVNVEQFQDDVVTLTVYADDGISNVSASVRIVLYKIYWGDTHIHSKCSCEKVGSSTDPCYIDEWLPIAHDRKVVENRWWALDFVVDQPHQEGSYMADANGFPKGNWTYRRYIDNLYNDPGNFTVLIGGEFTLISAPLFHLTVIYSGDCNDLPADATLQCPWMEANCGANTCPNATDTLAGVAQRLWWIVNHTSEDVIIYQHHPAWAVGWTGFDNYWDGWGEAFKERFFKGVEVVSVHGCAIDKYTDGLPYVKAGPHTDSTNVATFPEYAAWRWANRTGNYRQRIFSFIGSTDSHHKYLDNAQNYVFTKDNYPPGRVAVWAKYNNRTEIFNALKYGRVCAADYNNINLNVRVEGEHAFGNWINISGDANIEITAWTRNPGIEITDVYIVKLSASSTFQNATVVEHIGNGTAGLPSSFINYQTTVPVNENDVLWVTVWGYNASDAGLQISQNHFPVSRNPWRVWSSPIFIDFKLSSKPHLLSCEGIDANTSPTIDTTTPTFTWNWSDISNPQYYDLQVWSLDGSFNYTVNVSHSKYVVGDHIEYTWTSEGEPLLSRGKTYKWRVRCYYLG